MFINETIILYTLNMQCCMSIISQKNWKKEQVGLFWVVVTILTMYLCWNYVFTN